MNAQVKPYRYQHHIRSFVFLRWLLPFVAGYLAWFSNAVRPSLFVLATSLVGFALSNILFMLASREQIESGTILKAIAFTDIAFASVTFYLLREPGSYFFLLFAIAFAIAAIWRNVRFAALSFLGIGLLYGLFALGGGPGVSLSTVLTRLGSDIQRVLTLSLFFVVAVVYLFLSDRLRRDANLSMILLEEKRRSDVMVEIARSLSSSLQSREVLYHVAKKISEVFDAAECSIVRPHEDGRSATVLVRASNKDVGEIQISLIEHPELADALVSRDLLFATKPRGSSGSVVVLPLIARETLLGLIHLQLKVVSENLDEADVRFLKMVSLSAANALRNAQLFEEMEHLARTDFMTGLANHRYFQETLAMELARAHRHNHPLSLLMLDLDHLKEINDQFGHLAGDAAIRGVAQMIRASCRDFDVGARYGGEEFAVILPETQLAGAILVAERIRERIHFMEVPGVGRVTASIGVANYPVNAVSKDDLIHAADFALYQAKRRGRDRVSHIAYRLRDRA